MEESEMGRRLFVGNLSYDTTEIGLRELFSSQGTVSEAKIVMDRETGRTRGFGFVEMSSAEEASMAIAKLDGCDVDGRAISVTEARERR
jgi:cold-inducible RNA-binding protein